MCKYVALKRILLFAIIGLIACVSEAQQPVSRTGKTPSSKKEERRKKINAMIKQAEEGVLVYNKQHTYGVQGRSNGYGLFYELGRMKTPLRTNVYRIDITEIKHLKENKFQNLSNPFLFLSNPYVYGKVNNFYPLTLGFGQQRMLGQKGNKNGVSVSTVYQGGVSMGILKPYFLQVEDPVTNQLKYIQYSSADSALFLSQNIMGAGGLWRGWDQIKVKPGIFTKGSLRFDYGRFHEVVSALELGISAEVYTQKIPIMALQKDKSFFFQGYVSILFGRRK